MMDVDIDVANRDKLLELIQYVPARMHGRKHNTGIYTHRVPFNPLDGFCTIDHNEAEEAGYFKIDILNVNIYKDVRDENHLLELMNAPVMWELLEHSEFVEKIFHISNHSDIMKTLRPTNVQELAMALAIIRPGKRHLLTKSWKEIEKEVWVRPTDGKYHFKKSHAMSYAFAVIVHMNLVCSHLSN